MSIGPIYDIEALTNLGSNNTNSVSTVYREPDKLDKPIKIYKPIQQGRKMDTNIVWTREDERYMHRYLSGEEYDERSAIEYMSRISNRANIAKYVLAVGLAICMLLGSYMAYLFIKSILP